mgnify:CR=1 FL=1
MRRALALGVGVALLLALGVTTACGGAGSPLNAPGSPVTAPGSPATPAATATPLPSPDRPELLLATTTSTQDSGLLDVLVPDFERRTGYKVKTTAVGTGAALAIGARGDADVLLVHAPDAELDFMRAGSGGRRLLVAHNDFILVGPPGDPAAVKGRSVREALAAIATAKATFISRGDRSGTDLLEKALWKDVAVPAAPWYVESGTGMGQSLVVASERRAYLLTDRATYLARKDALQLAVMVEGATELLNYYHVITVSQTKFSKVNAGGANAFADYLVSSAAQQLVATFGRERYGQPLFFADAGKGT